MADVVKNSDVELDDGAAVQYKVATRDVDQPRLEFDSTGTLSVFVPDTSVDIDRVLEAEKSWIQKQYNAQQTTVEKLTQKYGELDSGLVLWGHSFAYETSTGPFEANVTGDTVSVRTPTSRDPLPFLLNTITDALRELLTELAKPLTAEFDVSYDQFHIRNQQTKWASCSTSGTVSFNIRTAFLPVSHVRYLLAHELAHLEHPNHSPEFWGVVRSAIPQPSDRAAELNGFWLLVHRNPVWQNLLAHW